MAGAPLHPQEVKRQVAVDALDLASPAFLDAYDSVVRLTQAALQVPICLFSVLDHNRQFFKAGAGLDVRETPREYAFCGHSILQDDLSQVFSVEDAHLDDRFRENPLVTAEPNIRFYAGVPIREPNGLPVGTLCVIDRAPRVCDSAMQNLLRHGRKLIEDQLRLYAESVSDPLTGLHNRRFLSDTLEREWRRAYRHSVPLTLLVVDVDHFKSYNDHYGHLKGDLTLQLIANALKASCNRPMDLVARYGGEEFVVVLPETGIQGAEEVAARILTTISGLGIPHQGSPHEHITVSLGGAVANEPSALDAGHTQVLKSADEALYGAKRAGRNRFRVLTLESGQKPGSITGG